jgi:CheY-like chemotaxis protein
MSARILVVEDDPVSLELMAYLLTAFGHTVLRAADGVEALRVARRELPDLVLCDNQLPVLSGVEVARELKSAAATRGIPLVSVTAAAMPGDRQRLLEAGFDGYLAKPITPETFVQEVEAYLPAAMRTGGGRRP